MDVFAPCSLEGAGAAAAAPSDVGADDDVVTAAAGGTGCCCAVEAATGAALVPEGGMDAAGPPCVLAQPAANSASKRMDGRMFIKIAPIWGYAAVGLLVCCGPAQAITDRAGLCRDGTSRFQRSFHTLIVRRHKQGLATVK